MPKTVKEIRVDRAWVGAPEGASFTNPTLWLFLLTLAALGVGSAGYLSGAWPAGATIALNALAIYVGFTVLHEGMHGIAHRNRFVNGAIARITGMLLTISFPMFRGVHYEHHSHTNDPERDPDLIVANQPRWLLPLWCLGVAVEYRRKFYGHRLWRNRAELAEALAMEAFLAAAVVASAAMGTLGTLAVIWLVPAALAVLFLAFAFDFLPHYPYDNETRYFDTRIYPSRLLNVVLLGQNYHLIHHLWTTIPWYRYRGVFARIEPELESRGARVGWSVGPLPAGVPVRQPSTAA